MSLKRKHVTFMLKRIEMFCFSQKVSCSSQITSVDLHSSSGLQPDPSPASSTRASKAATQLISLRPDQ
uniref:Uncharacterized protein n=1 Tax=Scophthalmus maximus TaxID=52904 RepID=A0A8D3CW13_SCOMX